jgi:hypothetical protein
MKKLAGRAPPPAPELRVASRFAGLPSTVTPRRPVLNAAPTNATHLPNIALVNGQQIVSPDEVNSIDLAADVPGLEQAASIRASPTLLAQALSVIGGALAAVALGLS